MRGTSSIEQDSRYQDKDKLLVNKTKFPKGFEIKVNLNKVNLEVFKLWIHSKIEELTGSDDEMIADYAISLLENNKSNPDPKQIQIQLAGFLTIDNAAVFMKELWKLLVEAQSSESGVPEALLALEMDRIKKEQEEQERIGRKIQEKMYDRGGHDRYDSRDQRDSSRSYNNQRRDAPSNKPEQQEATSSERRGIDDYRQRSNRSESTTNERKPRDTSFYDNPQRRGDKRYGSTTSDYDHTRRGDSRDSFRRDNRDYYDQNDRRGGEGRKSSTYHYHSRSEKYASSEEEKRNSPPRKYRSSSSQQQESITTSEGSSTQRKLPPPPPSSSDSDSDGDTYISRRRSNQDKTTPKNTSSFNELRKRALDSMNKTM